MMQEVQIVALSNSESSPGNYVVVLEGVNINKRIAIIIGAYEAQAIAVHLERMELPRPLTHDIFKATINELNAWLKEVVIHSLVNNMFHASLVLQTANQETKTIDARASDAIALAVRFDCPIMVEKEVFETSALQEPPKQSLIKGSLAEYSLEELENLLQSVLAKEDYESASRVRDLINKKKQ